MDIIKECDKIGRLPKTARFVYTDGDDFSINNAVENAAVQLGYTVGTMCCDAPRGLCRNVNRIAKWWNLAPPDFARLEGFVLCDDFRNGTVAVVVEFEQ